MSRKNRIMVVDDELIVRESLSAWLEKDGSVVERAESDRGVVLGARLCGRTRSAARA